MQAKVFRESARESHCRISERGGRGERNRYNHEFAERRSLDRAARPRAGAHLPDQRKERSRVAFSAEIDLLPRRVYGLGDQEVWIRALARHEFLNATRVDFGQIQI